MKRQHKIAAGIAGATAAVGTAIGLLKRRQDDRPAAHYPHQLPQSSLKQAIMETASDIGDKKLDVMAAGIAYYTLLAIFPALAAGIAITLMMVGPDEIKHISVALQAYMPDAVAQFFAQQVYNESHRETGNLIASLVAIALSLFGASGAIDNLMKALNTAYDCKETRNMFELKIRSLILTLSAILMGLIIAGLVVVSKDMLGSWGVPEVIIAGFSVLRWVFIVFLISILLAIMYRYGVNRPTPKWQWISWGATMATVLWLLATIAFFIYAQYFAGFSKTYSLFAGIIVLMMWLNLGAMAIIIGALINHRIEQKTAASTTK